MHSSLRHLTGKNVTHLPTWPIVHRLCTRETAKAMMVSDVQNDTHLLSMFSAVDSSPRACREKQKEDVVTSVQAQVRLLNEVA